MTHLCVDGKPLLSGLRELPLARASTIWSVQTLCRRAVGRFWDPVGALAAGTVGCHTASHLLIRSGFYSRAGDGELCLVMNLGVYTSRSQGKVLCLCNSWNTPELRDRIRLQGPDLTFCISFPCRVCIQCGDKRIWLSVLFMELTMSPWGKGIGRAQLEWDNKDLS